MILHITLGTTNGDEEFTVELAEGTFATYIGLELEVPQDLDHPHGLETIFRQSFRSEI